MDILKQAYEIVSERKEEKERQYGPFSASMEKAAEIFNAISPGVKLQTEDMFRAMVALKLSREAYCHREDNLLDAVAYLGALNNYINTNNE